MIKNTFIVISLLGCLWAGETLRYQQIVIPVLDEPTVTIVNELGIPLDHITRDKTGNWILTADEDQVRKLQERGVTLSILREDLTRYFQTRSRSVPREQREMPLGSMLGNYTYTEAMAQMDSLAALYPDLVSERISIGRSLEDRDIWAFKVSDNPNIDEEEPEVLYTGLIHAREPVSMMNLFYFVRQIGEGYGINSELTYVADHREMWFIPIINPDGYVYNEINHPDGGGMFRKNRRSNGCSDDYLGVDLNRNFSYAWGTDNVGSSPNECDATFRGDSAFSEPETRVVSNFIQNHEFQNVLHYHSYSNVLIHSFGDGSYPPEPDLTTLREIGAAMTAENEYPVGTGTELIGYPVNGDAVDWTYGDQGLISYTPEVGSFEDNFWPSEDRVIPICEDQLHQNIVFARVAGPDLEISQAFVREDESVTWAMGGIMELVVKNRGLSPCTADINMAISAINPNVMADTSNFVIEPLFARATDTVMVSFSYVNPVPYGTELSVEIFLETPGSISYSKTIYWQSGNRDTLFYDGAENGLTQWTIQSGNWGLTSDAYSGQRAITESPLGNYPSNSTQIIQLSETLDLMGYVYPAIGFAAKWDIEADWDFCRIQVSTDNENWQSLSGNYTTAGSGSGEQPENDPGYDGLQANWIQENIPLSSYLDSNTVNFRWVFTSDIYVTGDGFIFDDFSVTGYKPYIPGDLDIDQDLSIYDLLILSDRISDMDWTSTAELTLGDVNGDQSLDVADINFLLQQIQEDTP